jgi:hypothetical protein
MFVLLARRTGNREQWVLGGFTIKVALASALSGTACYALVGWIEPRMAWKTTIGAALLSTGASSFGFVLYVLLAMALRVREVEQSLGRICFWLRSMREANVPAKPATVLFEGE